MPQSQAECTVQDKLGVTKRDFQNGSLNRPQQVHRLVLVSAPFACPVPVNLPESSNHGFPTEEAGTLNATLSSFPLCLPLQLFLSLKVWKDSFKQRQKQTKKEVFLGQQVG